MCAAYYSPRQGFPSLFLRRITSARGLECKPGGIAVQLFDPKTIPLALASLELFGESDELDFDLEYRRNGTLNVALHAYQVPLLKRRYDELIQMGMDVRLWNDHQLRSFPGGDAKPFLSVCESPHDAQVNPLKATYGFALGAKRLGAKIMLHAPVAQMKTDQKAIHSIILRNGEEIACGRVVCAWGRSRKSAGVGRMSLWSLREAS
jgi:glycine/D-amino acid oxidase-like deaminating enzyme